MVGVVVARVGVRLWSVVGGRGGGVGGGYLSRVGWGCVLGGVVRVALVVCGLCSISIQQGDYCYPFCFVVLWAGLVLCTLG